MVDTARTLSALQTLLADNSNGNISPQDVRDMLVSILGEAALLYNVDQSTAQTGVTTTFTKLTFTNAASLVSGSITADTANSELDVSVAGLYALFFQCSFSGTLSTTFDFVASIDGTENVLGKCRRKLGTGGDVGSASFFSLLNISSPTNAVSIEVKSDAGGGASITPAHTQLLLVRVK